ncbi:MAG: AAA family ATPase [Rickettsiales bacterium]|nr:AAA family ATPase [Rickettsiales bacterium]
MTSSEVKSRVLSNIKPILNYLFPLGMTKGNQFLIGNIHGDKGDSLVVELSGSKAGLWNDFATGEGGDIFDLWALKNNLDVESQFPEIIKQLRDWLSLGHVSNKTIHQEQNKKKQPPTDNLGAYTGKWDYTDASGKLIACVYRYDTETGKEYRPWDAVKRKQKTPEIRPLYNQVGISKSNEVVLVEGEKSAQALIDIGICATTAMNGAKAPIDKTDWLPLKNKNVIVWPDNDEAGIEYGNKVAEHLAGICSSIKKLCPPQVWQLKYDAYDAIRDGVDVTSFLKTAVTVGRQKTPIYFFKDYHADETPMPEDLIAPRILTPSGIMVLGGAPKVGKTDFLLSLLTHMSAGKSFLGMTPAKALRIFYLQTEVGYFYMRERIKSIELDYIDHEAVGSNLAITPQLHLLLDEKTVPSLAKDVNEFFGANKPDILVIDPIRNVFDAGANGSENDNSSMLTFLKDRVERFKNLVNPDAGVVLVHHTRKLNKKSFEEDPFQSLSGAGSLRSYYSTGLMLYRPDENKPERQLYFELRNGAGIKTKIIDKIDGVWTETNINTQRIAQRELGRKLDAERDRKQDVILQIIYEEAEIGNVYTMRQFSEHFENKAGLGGKDSIKNRLDVLATKGHIKFFKNYKELGINAHVKSPYGFMCVKNMRLRVSDTEDFIEVLPTHFKCPSSGVKLEVENPKIWITQNLGTQSENYGD